MTSPYSNYALFAGATSAAAGVWGSPGSLAPTYTNGTILRLYVATEYSAPPTPVGTVLEVALGTGGGPVTTIYSFYDIQGGDPWVVTGVDYTGLFSQGILIPASGPLVWVRALAVATLGYRLGFVCAPA